MRIISGDFKGRRFHAPRTIPARPTTDFAKESLFNLINREISWNTCSMLDLYAGIGSISFEAVSRGAKHVTSVDINRNAVQWLNRVKSELSVKSITIIQTDALRWIKHNPITFDLVFADPPYDCDSYDLLIDLVLENALAERGMFILEHRKNRHFTEHPKFVSEKAYGEVGFSFFRITAK